MDVIKVIEILANSNKSWEDAAQQGINEASKTLKNIKSIYIKEHSAIVNETNKIVPKIIIFFFINVILIKYNN